MVKGTGEWEYGAYSGLACEFYRDDMQPNCGNAGVEHWLSAISFSLSEKGSYFERAPLDTGRDVFLCKSWSSPGSALEK